MPCAQEDATELEDSTNSIQNAAPPRVTDLNYCTSVTAGEEENHHTCGVPEHFGVRPGSRSPRGPYRAHAFKETHLLQSVHLGDNRRGSENDHHFACGMPEHQGVRPCHSLSGQQHGLEFSSIFDDSVSDMLSLQDSLGESTTGTTDDAVRFEMHEMSSDESKITKEGKCLLGIILYLCTLLQLLTNPSRY